MCPACKVPMVVFEFEGVEIDRCLDCGGTWLDAGELEMLVDLSGARPGELTRALVETEPVRKDRRRCPRCRRKLQVIQVGTDRPVELDRCPRGHGLWFDRGEMEAVVASFAEGDEGALAGYFKELFRFELTPTEGQ